MNIPQNNTPATQVDVIINGGGLVGLSQGIALATADMQVVVIDREDPMTMLDAPYDGRSSAIAWASQQALAVIGVWDHVAERAQAMLDIRVSDGSSPLFLHYDHHELDGQPFGYMVENRHMRQGLHARTAEISGLDLLAPASATEIRRHENGVEVRTEDGQQLQARLLIGAEGRRSPSREEAGIQVSGWSYHQVGIVCTAVHEQPHHGIAQEHFLPSGPFAILPLPGNRSSLVWTETDALAPVMMALDDEHFLAEIKKRFGDYLGELSLEGPRWSYPLSLQISDRYIDRRLVLAGDAAHGMHPIAGQGLNVGLRDVAALTEVLVEAARIGLDIGSGQVLERYQRWRRFDNATLLAVTDVLNRLFSNDIEPLHLARDLGLATVNKMPDLKKLFMHHARGTVGKLPRMLDGRPV